MISAFCKLCKWLKNNKLSPNTVKTAFMIIGTLPRLSQLDAGPKLTPCTIVIETQEVKRINLNNKWSVAAMVTALASYFYF